MFPYWRKQTVDSPLFPDIEWERPERRDQAGSLLIIGGSSHGFHTVSEAYQIAKDHGIGESHILYLSHYVNLPNICHMFCMVRQLTRDSLPVPRWKPCSTPHKQAMGCY